MNPHIFRQYDIRGIAEKDLTDPVIRLIGQATATYLVRERHYERPKLVLGRDIRPTSNRIRTALVSALQSSGVSIVDIGIVTTPLCYFSVNHLNTTGGIMITGSHNPPEYNGLKVIIGRSAIFGEALQRLEQLIEVQDFVCGHGTLETAETISAYRSFLRKAFQFRRRLKVVVDCGNGTAGLIAPQVVRDLGHDVVELFSEPDSRFPHHHPDPTVVENLQDAIEKVREAKADVALAFDGDADRIGVIDNEGTIIWPDKLLILFSRAILKDHPGSAVIADVKCSELFFEDVKQHGGRPIMWKTGHSLIKQKLMEEKALLGGEMSGHMFFADRYYGYDDGLYAGIRVLEIMDQTGKHLPELLQDLRKTYATPEIRVPCPDEEKFEVVRQAADYFKARYRTTLIDGVRIDFGDAWGLLRASNTQPVLVTRFEARSEARLQHIRSIVEEKIKEFSRNIPHLFPPPRGAGGGFPPTANPP